MDRLLRRSAGARAGADPEGPCLDAEVLAAWADGSLTAAEREVAEVHAADCDRCLAVLAALGTTTPPPSVPVGPRWFPARWLVPVATAAVAITAWVVIPAPQDPATQATAPSASVGSDTPKPAAPAAQQEKDTARQAPADAFEDKAVSPRPLSPSAEQLQKRRKAESQQLLRKDVPAETRERAAKADERTSADRAAPSPTPRAAAAPPAANAPAPPARFEARDATSDAAALAATQVAKVIASPDARTQWRIAGASVERSTDAGRTWRAQPTGTTVELLAGACPATSVCWIVGRRGTVLLSTDGDTWRRLAFPETAIDLVGVTASDASAATVTTVDGRSYRTADGGRTWALQENRATPF